MSTVSIIVWWSIIALFWMFVVYDCYVKKPKDKTIPDLRLSEFAPDLQTALKEDPLYGMKKKAREEAEYQAGYLKREEERTKERWARQRIIDEENKKIWLAYADEVNEAKAKRWMEGNPVTRENPLKEHEQPRKPFMSNGTLY